MSVSTIAELVKITAEHRHEDKSGRLISAASTRTGAGVEELTHWDSWRVAYCESHRNKKLPVSFREGKATLSNIILSLFLGYSGGK